MAGNDSMAGQPSTILFPQPTPSTVLSLPDIWVNLRLWSQVMLSPLLESHMLLKGKRQKSWMGGNTEEDSVIDRHSLGTRSTTAVNRATYIYSLSPHSLGIVSIPGTVPRVPGCWPGCRLSLWPEHSDIQSCGQSLQSFTDTFGGRRPKVKSPWLNSKNHHHLT